MSCLSHSLPCSNLFLFFYPYLRTCLLILVRGEGKERERKINIDVSEKHRPDASHLRLNCGQNLQTRHVPCSDIEPVTSRFTGRCSSQLSHIGQGALPQFNCTRCPFNCFNYWDCTYAFSPLKKSSRHIVLGSAFSNVLLTPFHQ